MSGKKYITFFFFDNVLVFLVVPSLDASMLQHSWIKGSGGKQDCRTKDTTKGGRAVAVKDYGLTRPPATIHAVWKKTNLEGQLQEWHYDYNNQSPHAWIEWS